MDARQARDLAALYRDLDDEVARLAPTCRACGACCRFREHGHDLFCSEVEAEYLLDDPGDVAGDADAMCPFLDGDICTRRKLRTLACRSYFCDSENSEGLAEITERMVSRLKTLHRAWDRPWRYARLSMHLESRNSCNDKG